MKLFWIITIIVILCIGMAFIVIKQPSNELKIVIVVSFMVFIGVLITLKFLKGSGVQYQQNIILVIGFAITIISWFVNGYINNENEKKKNDLSIKQSILQSKRDLKIKFLLDAFFRLENSDRRDTVPPGYQINPYDQIYLKYAETALTSIQLLAGDTTIRLANKYVHANGKDHFNELLKMLRNELRKELELSDLPDTEEFNPTEFRTYRKLNSPGILTPQQQYDLTIKLNEFQRELIK